MNGLLHGSVGRLAIPIQVVTWIMGFIAPFLIPPPEVWHGAPTNGIWLPFVQFVLVFVVSGSTMLARHDRSLRRGSTWAKICIFSLVSGVVLFVIYQWLMANWTCLYYIAPDGAHVYTVIGSELLESVSEAVRQSRTCQEKVQGAAGLTNMLWPSSQLLTRQITISAIFAAVSCAFTVAVIALVEALKLSELGRRG
jgi:hypothetical protein